jgi:hypothetical protein
MVYAIVKIGSGDTRSSRSETEEYCILGSDAVKSGRCLLTLRGNVENLLSWRWKQNDPPKCPLIFARLYGVSSQTTTFLKRSFIFSMMGLQFLHSSGGKRNVKGWESLSCITTLYQLHSYSASNYRPMHGQSYQVHAHFLWFRLLWAQPRCTPPLFERLILNTPCFVTSNNRFCKFCITLSRP